METELYKLDSLHILEVNKDIAEPKLRLNFTQAGYGEDGVAYPAQEIFLHRPAALRKLYDVLDAHFNPKP